jgi:hypothetical protein
MNIIFVVDIKVVESYNFETFYSCIGKGLGNAS